MLNASLYILLTLLDALLRILGIKLKPVPVPVRSKYALLPHQFSSSRSLTDLRGPHFGYAPRETRL